MKMCEKLEIQRKDAVDAAADAWTFPVFLNKLCIACSIYIHKQKYEQNNFMLIIFR
jgi:hypothetical protein